MLFVNELMEQYFNSVRQRVQLEVRSLYILNNLLSICALFFFSRFDYLYVL